MQSVFKDHYKPNLLDGPLEKQNNQNKKTNIEFSGTKVFYNQTVNSQFFKNGQIPKKNDAEDKISELLKKDL